MELSEKIVGLVPLLFHRLKAVGDELHKEHQVTTSMRGVMQSLFNGEPRTVPQLAAARPVSRQHIQTIVDTLLERGLVQQIANPSHKRSNLIDLTEEGCELFVKMREAELQILRSTLGRISASDLEITQTVLSRFAAQLAHIIQTQKETGNDD